MAKDGEVVISTALDNSQLEKQLQDTKKKIVSLEEKLNKAEQERSPILAQLTEMEEKLRQAAGEAKRFGEQWSSGELGADRLQMEAQARLAALERENDALLEKAAKYDDIIAQTTQELERQETAAGQLTKELAQAAAQSSRMGEAVDAAGAYMNRFTKWVKNLARQVFVFTIISSILRSLRDWLGRVVQTNHEASQAVAKLRGALLTLGQPLVEVVIPAFTLLVQLLTRLVSAAAQLFSWLFGKSIADTKKAASGLYQETEALDALGGSAEEAKKSLAGFDELNVLPGKDGAAANTDVSAPDFDFDAALSEERLKGILGLVKTVAVGLLAWKLANSLLDGLQKFAGLLLAIDGGIGLAEATMDAWTNGVTWENFLAMLGRGAELTAGLALAFGKAGAGVGLIVTGLTLLVTAFHDAAQNGWNLQNTLMAIAGIIATGLGIALLTGSWIPLLIAMIAALLLAIVVAFGDGEALIEGAKKFLKGFLDFFVGLFTGDFQRAMTGIKEIFAGLQQILFTVIEALKNMLFSFFDWLDEQTGGRFHGAIETIKAGIGNFFQWLQESTAGLVAAVQQIFEGLLLFFTGVFTGDWDKAWQGVQEIFKGVWNGIVSCFEAAVNLIIRGVNRLIERINSIRLEAPDWVPGIGGKSWSPQIPSLSEVKLPRLATGTVVPPNREFLAVLGDNKKEPEIVSPVSTLKEAFLAALKESGGGAGGKATIILDSRVLGEFAIDYINGVTETTGVCPVLV